MKVLPSRSVRPGVRAWAARRLGIPLLRGSILLTYLAHPEAPINPHPLFDHTHFARLDREISHLEDYMRRVRRGETPPSPHVLFDRAFYYEWNPDVAARKADAFVHYVRAGWRIASRTPIQGGPLDPIACSARRGTSAGKSAVRLLYRSVDMVGGDAPLVRSSLFA